MLTKLFSKINKGKVLIGRNISKTGYAWEEEKNIIYEYDGGDIMGDATPEERGLRFSYDDQKYNEWYR